MSKTVHGVWLIQGDDCIGQLNCSLQALSLESAIGGTNLQPANVEMAWVRRFGPTGVVMIRFSCHPDTYRHLQSSRVRQQACDAIRSLNTDKYSIATFVPPVLTVEPASEPAASDPSVSSARFRSDCASQLWRTDQAEALRHFVAIVSSIPGVELAQYDSVEYGESGNEQLREYIRVIDHLRRGKEWLKSQVDYANALSFGYINKHYTNEKPRQFSYDEESNTQTLIQCGQPTELEQFLQPFMKGDGPRPGLLYLCVHCVDYPGAFADVATVLQRIVPPLRRGARPAIRIAACRSMGDQSVIMLATDAPKEGAREQVETDLRQGIEQHFADRRTPSMYGRRRYKGVDSLHDVRAWTAAGGNAESSGGSQHIFGVYAQHDADQPGLLRAICDAIYKCDQRANFGFLDGRVGRQVGAAKFRVAMGVKCSGSDARDKAINAVEGICSDSNGWNCMVVKLE